MTCREFVEFLMAYLERELEAGPRAVFEQHLDACPSCRDYLVTYEDTIRLGQLACDETGDVPEEAPEALVQAILAARSAS